MSPFVGRKCRNRGNGESNLTLGRQRGEKKETGQQKPERTLFKSRCSSSSCPSSSHSGSFGQVWRAELTNGRLSAPPEQTEMTIFGSPDSTVSHHWGALVSGPLKWEPLTPVPSPFPKPLLPCPPCGVNWQEISLKPTGKVTESSCCVV